MAGAIWKPTLDPVPLAELHSQHHIAAQPTRGTAEVTQPNPEGDVAWEFTLPHLHKTIYGGWPEPF